MKRLMGMVLIGAMVCSLLGCSGAGTSEDTKVSGTDGAQEKTELSETGEKAAGETSGAGEEQITLNMWHIQTNVNDPTAIALFDAIEQYEKEHPNVKINQDATQGEQYKVKIRTAVAADELPDIFMAWGYTFAEPFVESGKVLNLEPYLGDGTKEKIKPGVLNVLSYDDQVYGLPVDFTGMLMFYNKELFEQNGLEIPETYQELVTVMDAFQSKGIEPMIIGGKAMWPLTALYEAMAIRTAGVDSNRKVVAGEESMNQEGYRKAAEYFQNLTNRGGFTADSMNLIPPDANTKFAAGGIPMTFNGTWSVGVFDKEDSAVKGKLVAAPFPVIEGEMNKEGEYLGASLSGYMVSNNSKHKEVAVDALKFITEQTAKNLYQSGAGFPAWNVSVDESTMSPFLIELNEMYGGLSEGIPNWDTTLAADVVEDYKNTTTMLSLGEITPDQYIEMMEEYLK